MKAEDDGSQQARETRMKPGYEKVEQRHGQAPGQSRIDPRLDRWVRREDLKQPIQNKEQVVGPAPGKRIERVGQSVHLVEP